MKNKVALITGATRGIGKGIALALAKQGAIVYFTGRTERENETATNLPGSIVRTEKEIEEAGYRGFGIKCDHTNDAETKAAVNTVIQRQGRIDILVNNIWGGYEYYHDGTPFWEEKGFWDAPISRYDKMMQAGVRAHYVTSRYVVPYMLSQGSGAIFNLSFWAAEQDDKGVAYGMSKAATNQMTKTMAHELRDRNISVLTVYPGLVRTENVMKSADYFDLSNSESPEFIGMSIAALADDEAIMNKSGTIQIAAQVALDYHFTDIDGKQPAPLSHG